MKIFAGILVYAVVIFRGEAGITRCTLDGKPISCDDPEYVSAEPDTFGCYLDGKPVNCNDPVYLQIKDKGGDSGTVRYGYNKVDNKLNCAINGVLVPCNDSLFDEVFGGLNRSRDINSQFFVAGRGKSTTSKSPSYPSRLSRSLKQNDTNDDIFLQIVIPR